MYIPTITLEDLPSDKANCGNCTRKLGVCLRTHSNKRQHNGYFYDSNGEVVGMITKCPNYTGPFDSTQLEIQW